MRIVLATWGSFGDLHPFLALGNGLRSRGHDVVLATSALYREKVGREGIGFAPMRPDLPTPEQVGPEMARWMDARGGPKAVLRDTVVPAVREQFVDLRAACVGADCLVAHPIVVAAPMVSDIDGIPLVGAALQPILFLSAHDPCVPPGVPALVEAPLPPPWMMAPILRRVRHHLRGWTGPVDSLRQELGLPDRGHPLFEAPFHNGTNLALWDPVLGGPQPDWPPGTVQTGFPFHDTLGAEPPEAPGRTHWESFLESGPAPVCFTLGTSAVVDPGAFWDSAVGACRRLGLRAVLLVGRHTGAWKPVRSDPNVCVVDYAPHSEIMPRCAAIVHQGGVGTTGQALRSGRPQVVVPWSHDQPDHARRIAKAGLGVFVPRHRIGAKRFETALAQVLGDKSVVDRAKEVGELVAGRDAVAHACAVIEGLAERSDSRVVSG